MGTILVTGATGSVGRLVVDHLLAAGATDVRALTNNLRKAALPAGVEVFEGYLREPATLPPALADVELLYLAPAPETIHEVLPLVRQAGVRQVVDLSGEPGSWWHAIVEAVESAGIGWTHLWPGEFMENATTWAEQIRTTGLVREPYPTSANAPIAMDDVAAAAASVLLDGGHDGRAYALTGPETLSRAEMVRLIGQALGRTIPFLQVSREEAVEMLSARMGEYADWYVDGLASLAEHPQAAGTTVAEITGRPATRFAEWAVEHAAAFR